MHSAHSGNTASAVWLPLITQAHRNTFMNEKGSAFALLFSYLPVGLWPSFCSAFFLCGGAVAEFARQISNFARLCCKKRISASDVANAIARA
jgi:hypothetical protein